MRSIYVAVIVLVSTLLTFAQQAPTSNTATVDPDGTTRVTRVVPVPGTISAEAKQYLSRPYSDDEPPATPEQNRAMADHWQEQLAKDMQTMYPATTEKSTIVGVPVRIITPKSLAPEKKDRVLINVHGGGFQADWGSVAETIPIASLTKTKVVAILYRLSPENKFPAAVDDTIAVYKELLKTHKPEQMVLYGTSAGAILTGEVAVRIKQLGLPEPAALGIFSGNGDMGDFGDSLAIYGLHGLSGTIDPPGKKHDDDYTGSADKHDPVLSPLYADLKGMPPTLFLTSTRDLLLSGTVLLHKAYLHAGVPAELVVWDALPHAFWNEYKMPEAIEAHHIMVEFFERHLH
ncbi:MAG: alpha/beta hydrolase [Terriglobales bacterium]